MQTTDDFIALARLAVNTANQHQRINESHIYAEYLSTARNYYRLACRQNPDDLQLKLELLEIQDFSAPPDEANYLIQKLLAHDTDRQIHARVYLQWGYLTRARNHEISNTRPPTSDEASEPLTHFRKALELDSNNEDIVVTLADEIQDQGKDEDAQEAINILLTFLTQHPQSPSALKQLGYVYHQEKQWQNTVHTYNQLAHIQPLVSYQMSHLAGALFHLDQIINGVEHSIQSRELNDAESRSEIINYQPSGLRQPAFDALLRDVAKEVESDLSNMETRATLAMLLEFSGYGDAKNHADELISLIDLEDRGHLETLAERATIQINEELSRLLIPINFTNPWPPNDPLKEYQDRPYHKVLTNEPSNEPDEFPRFHLDSPNSYPNDDDLD